VLADLNLSVFTRVRAGPGPGTVLTRSNVASVWPRNIFWTGLGPRAAFAHDM